MVQLRMMDTTPSRCGSSKLIILTVVILLGINDADDHHNGLLQLLVQKPFYLTSLFSVDSNAFEGDTDADDNEKDLLQLMILIMIPMVMTINV